MKDAERLGRSIPRNYTGDAYLKTHTVRELESIHSDLRALLAESGAQAIVYDEEATAYAEDGLLVLRPKTEPVMLHRWKGMLHGKVPILPQGQREFDTVGLKIILRGRGRIQDIIRDFLCETVPDEDSTEECETYTFGCKNRGVEDWQ